jgi:cobalt-zinc-cadmium efflux system protein
MPARRSVRVEVVTHSIGRGFRTSLVAVTSVRRPRALVERDPLFAALIGLFILPRAWRLGHEALRILVQAAPRNLDLEALELDLTSIDGVVDVHDLHVWTLTSEMDVATVHLTTGDATDTHQVLDRARDLLQNRHNLAHATLQVEPDTHQGCSELSW